MTHPILSKAPIVEALVDLSVKSAAGISHADLTEVKDAFKERYPTAKELRSFMADVQVNADRGSSHSVTTEVVGYRLEKNDQPFVVLLRRNGLTVSRLKPYTTWEDLIAEARYVWSRYLEVCKPEAVSKVATRFINNLELPAIGLDFDDYLAAPPRIPKNLPEVLKEFLVRLVVPDESGAEIAILQSLQGTDLGTQTVHVILDIDVYKVVQMDPRSEDPWQLLDIMRRLKNSTFFGAITPRTLELIK